MSIREYLKKFAYKHQSLLNVYRNTIGKAKRRALYSLQRKALQKDGAQLIGEVATLLNGAGAKFFLDCGSLLGFVRTNTTIQHDSDIDFAVYFDDAFRPKDLDKVMTRAGFRIKRCFKLCGNVEELTYSKGVLNVDFFNHREIDGKSSFFVFDKCSDRDYPSVDCHTAYRLERCGISDIAKMSIGGAEVPIPSNAEDYLESAYGPSWRVPNPAWTYKQEAGCSEFLGGLGILTTDGF